MDLGKRARLFLHRVFGRPAEDAPAAVEPAEGFGEFEDMLDALGATAPEPGEDARLAARDATIAELQTMLAGLRPLGEQLAATERARLAAEARLAELEASQAKALVRKLGAREAVLARERERHAATREKLAERQRVAADRWREVQGLRAAKRRLERELQEERRRFDAVSPALPAPAAVTTPPTTDDPNPISLSELMRLEARAAERSATQS